MNKKIQLFAPVGYINLTPDRKKFICNGCGAKSGIKVPSTFWGLDISEACQIHDYMYYVGKTYADKLEADRVFKNNLTRIINARTGSWLFRKLRHRRKKTYVYFVSEWGDTAYWEDKNKPKNMIEIA